MMDAYFIIIIFYLDDMAILTLQIYFKWYL